MQSTYDEGMISILIRVVYSRVTLSSSTGHEGTLNLL